MACSTAAPARTAAPRPAHPSRFQLFEQQRRQRLPLWRIARETGRSLATVARHMDRIGLSRLASLEPPQPVRRYERASPSELLHINTKRLGRIHGVGHRITGDRTQNRNRGIGWDAVHLAIDDHSRVSFAQVLADETALSCVQFLRDAVAYYANIGVRIERVMTDNGPGYKNAFRAARRGIGHPPHPHAALYAQDQRQGRAIRTDQPAGVGPMPDPTKAQPNARLPCSPSLTATTGAGQHSALGHQPPITRIPGVNNLVRLNI